jgi:hypothetical protein
VDRQVEVTVRALDAFAAEVDRATAVLGGGAARPAGR